MVDGLNWHWIALMCVGPLPFAVRWPPSSGAGTNPFLATSPHRRDFRFRLVFPAIVLQRDRACINRDAIEFSRRDSLRSVLGIHTVKRYRVRPIVHSSEYCGQTAGMQGFTLMVAPCRRSPSSDWMAAWYIHPAEPVYHVQPPRPTCIGCA